MNQTHKLSTTLVALAFAAASFLAGEHNAIASSADDADGVYGRFDGDLDLRVGAGASVAQGGVGLSAFLSTLYLSSAGLYAHYTDALGAEGPTIARSIAAGLVLEPLFLGRFASDLERGPARLDLLIDSFSLSLGAVWEQRNLSTPFAKEPGIELAVGLGFPFFAAARGLSLGVRGALRVRPEVVSGQAPFALVEQGALLSITLNWRQILPVHLVDAGDRLDRE